MLRSTIFLWLIWTSVASASAHAQQACLSQARNSYEELYCKVAASDENNGLPSLADFRRNPPETQALLLRRPAARLGLKMPERLRKKADVPAAAADVVQQERSTRQEKSEPASTANTGANSLSLDSCVLAQDTIRCTEKIFRLVSNRDNQELVAGALSVNNRLALPQRSGEHAQRDYLIDAYQTYIEKMLEIGLGASTMTFSKFYYTYEELHQQEVDFSHRMEKMFDYLKQDKAAMAVRRRYSHQLPENIAQCGRLSAQLIVCDEGDVNWVYELR